jgi:hypothetical protein
MAKLPIKSVPGHTLDETMENREPSWLASEEGVLIATPDRAQAKSSDRETSTLNPGLFSNGVEGANQTLW